MQKKTGYTKAVDLWALGCVTVVLLTGGYPFVRPGTSQFCERLARECNLDELEQSRCWREVGARPKAFVRELLVLDENKRSTARRSLEHEWFSNDTHRTDFEELYQRTIRHWRPRIAKRPVIEFVDSEELRHLPFLKDLSAFPHTNPKKG